MSVRSVEAATWQPSQFLSVLDLTPGELETCLDSGGVDEGRAARRPRRTRRR